MIFCVEENVKKVNLFEVNLWVKFMSNLCYKIYIFAPNFMYRYNSGR